MKKSLGKLGVVLVIGVIVAAYFALDLGRFISLGFLKDQQSALQEYFSAKPWLTAGLFSLIYIVSTALSLPGAAVLTLAAGAIFGVIFGTIIVSFASTIGATLAFLISRFLLRDFVENRFADRLASVNRGLEKEGSFYLLTLRLVPLFPFFLINLLMGLTKMRTLTFFFVSQIGMLAGTVVYVNAGTQLAQINSLKGILSPGLLFSFALVGVLPLISKWALDSLRMRRNLSRFKKPRQFDYNLVVIGAGSAGLVSAYIAAAIRAKVALIEKHKMGGDCLNTGCVPSKTLIRSAKIMHMVRQAKAFGIDSGDASVNFSQVMERVQRVIKTIEPHDSVERYTGLGVDCVQGAAQIKSPYEVEVNGRLLKTRSIIIATGASPLVPDIPGLAQVPFYTSDTIWNLRELPKRLVVLGGGPIGCELAQSFARLGSQVTIIERRTHLLAREDDDVADVVTQSLKKDGVQVEVGQTTESIDPQEKVVVCNSGGKKLAVPFDELLVAVGRRPNVSGFGLETLGAEVVERGGGLKVDEFLRCSGFPNIYGCGDVVGPYQFTHAAAHQAWYASVNALARPFKKYRVDYRVIPFCTFTDPEVARVGLNEVEAREAGVPYEVTRYELDDLDRAIADGTRAGFVKVLTVPGKDKILGAMIVGEHAGEIISEFVSAMKNGIGLNRILGTIHIYPTFSEANKYAAGVWKKAHAPEQLLQLATRFHAWRR